MPRLTPLPRLPPSLLLVLRYTLLRSTHNHHVPHPQSRPFTSTHPPSSSKPLPPRRTIPESELEENFLKGSGPGGQKINKTSSAVQLKHLPTGMVVKYQDTRSRSLNRKHARRILGERLELLEKGEESRVMVRAREKSRKKASATKKKRRKYRKIGEGDGEGEEEEEEEEEEEGEDGEERPNVTTTESEGNAGR